MCRAALRFAVLGVVCAFTVSAFGKTTDVIEYYNAGKDHYFFSSLPSEIDALDSGKMPGWTRTGLAFPAYPNVATGATRVCRFYIPPAMGDSHFYSASAAECALTHSTFPGFVEETSDAMYVHLPDVKTGACPVKDAPVYRVWNKRADSNHRYTTDKALRDHMVSLGWTPEGYGSSQVAMCAPTKDDEPDPPMGPLPPPCKGTDPRVAVPGAPHGMYVWAPGAFVTQFLVKDVIAKNADGTQKDPTLCGASLVIFWSQVEAQKGVFDWSAVTTAAQPFTDAGLTVNLLFQDSTEGPTNNVTPTWVTSATGDNVPTVTCSKDPTIPVFWNPTFEADWSAFIAAAVHQFSYANSPLAASVGYLRFATAGGAEALPPPDYDNTDVSSGPSMNGAAPTISCAQAWKNAGYTLDVWNTHEANVINAMGSQSTDKQIMASLPNISGGATVYTVSNLGAAAAVAKGVGLSFENLGASNIAAVGTTPAPCDPTADIVNLHWCQAYTKYVGQVPLAMQPITPTTKAAPGTMDISNLLQYALINNIQIFELYAEEWLSADSPTWGQFDSTKQREYCEALNTAAAALGTVGGQTPNKCAATATSATGPGKNVSR